MTINLPFSRDTAKYIAEAEQDIKNTVLLGGPHDPMSLALAGVIGMTRSLIEGDLIKLVEQYTNDWLTMPEDRLFAEALRQLSITPRAAGAARGFATISGAAGTTFPSTLSVMANGIEYKLDTSSTYPATMPLAGSVALPVIAVTPGTSGNQSTATSGVLSTNIAGLQNYVTNVITVGGYNAETVAEFRERAGKVDALEATPGSAPWHARRAYRYPGVTRVCVDRCNCCEGQVTLRVFADAAFPHGIPDSDFISRMQREVFDTPIGSSQWGSMLITRTGIVAAATRVDLKIKVTGVGNLLAQSRKKAEDEIRAYVASLCPSSFLCKATILSIVSSHGSCPLGVSFEFASGFNDNQDGYLYADCGVIANVTEVCLV